ncbi:hypothetical protein [Candidatus Cytomitobacter primus]|uniref:Uncharacterized protein n=1 Tax=Candidatus Cytomitobacter primus TaxID=2066024 RepID=A0A5C0UEY1_9PROT|nr:hypothetical protein [Candidatus Cytomitobacter primus]QEK38656.1 hypothetical protein FZC34_01905 [Candidatus Cytomitobacter primus]
MKHIDSDYIGQNLLKMARNLSMVCASIGAVVWNSEFHIFDVGQGNCQLNKYNTSAGRIGFLYDCGSCVYPWNDMMGDENIKAAYEAKKKAEKAVEELIKQFYFQSYLQQGINTIFAHKNAVSEEDISCAYKEFSLSTYMQENEESDILQFDDKKIKEKIDTLIDSLTGYKKREAESIKTALELSIIANRKYANASRKNVENKMISRVNSKLKDLDLLIIFLSHPEKDHINKIEKLIYPIKTDVISFLCGDWHNKNTGEMHKAERSLSPQRDRSENANNLPSNDDTKYTGVNEVIKVSGYTAGYYHLSFYEYPFFAGDIKKLFDVTKKRSSIYTSILYKFDNAINQLKDYIYIWSMNTTGCNAASPIISFTHKYSKHCISKQVSMLCTGDAEDSTAFELIKNLCTGDAEDSTAFKLVKNKDKKSNMLLKDILEKIDKLKQISGKSYESAINELIKLLPNDNLLKGDIICLTPHHGSAGQATTMLLLNKLFKPSVIYVSAGHGTQQPHPHINWYKEIIKLDKGAINYYISYILHLFNNKTDNVAYNYLKSDLNNLITFSSDKDQKTISKKITSYQKKGDGGEKKYCPDWLYSTNDHGSASSIQLKISYLNHLYNNIAEYIINSDINNKIKKIMKNEVKNLDLNIIKLCAFLSLSASAVDYIAGNEDFYWSKLTIGSFTYPYVACRSGIKLAEYVISSDMNNEFAKIMKNEAELPIRSNAGELNLIEVLSIISSLTYAIDYIAQNNLLCTKIFAGSIVYPYIAIRSIVNIIEYMEYDMQNHVYRDYYTKAMLFFIATISTYHIDYMTNNDLICMKILAGSVISSYPVYKLVVNTANLIKYEANLLSKDNFKNLKSIASSISLLLATDYMRTNSFYWTKFMLGGALFQHIFSQLRNNSEEDMYSLLIASMYPIMYCKMIGSDDVEWDTRMINVNSAFIPMQLAYLLFNGPAITKNIRVMDFVLHIIGFVFYDFLYSLSPIFVQ